MLEADRVSVGRKFSASNISNRKVALNPIVAMDESEPLVR